MHSWYNTFQILATNRNGVMVMKIPLQQVIEAIEMADDAFTALWDSKTGETVYLDDGLISGMRNEELENLLETEGERFYRFPTKWDIHEYSIMEDFIDSLTPGGIQDELAWAIRGSGAFRRFKDKLYFFGIEQQWYDFRDNAFRELAIRWCRDNELEYTE